MNRMNTVLLATGSKYLKEHLAFPTRNANLAMMTVNTPEMIMPIIEKDKPDLLLLDTRLTGSETASALTELRNTTKESVILLTDGLNPEELRPLLTLNVDDFILLSASEEEITLRLQAHFDKKEAFKTPSFTPANDKIAASDLLLDRTRHIVTQDNRRLDLTSTEFRILELLMTHPDYVFSRKEIYELVWNNIYMDDDSKIMMHISNLRTKIGDKPGARYRIVTVKGKGYKFASNSDHHK